MQWLWYSLVASVVLTVVLNVALRLWPRSAGRGAERLDDLARQRHDGGEPGRMRVRVVVPWRTMLFVSVVATVVLNVLVRLG